MKTKPESSRRLERIHRLLLPLAGLGALIWFLIRVIPKPSRARYPCMRAAMPLASSFVIGLISFGGSVCLFKKARSFLYRARYGLFGACLAGGLALGLISLARTQAAAQIKAPATRFQAARPAYDGPNMPMGQGQGIFPGRVVWVHDPEATNEGYSFWTSPSWYDESNLHQGAVSSMLDRGLAALTGVDDPVDALEAIFRHFNKARGRGDRGYEKGEKIVIKINMNGLGNGSRDNINTSPQILIAILDRLVKGLKIPQDAITMGEPNISMDRITYASLLKAYPGVRTFERGRTKATKGDAIFASDGRASDPLPQAYIDADYMINVPVLKKHHRAGISLTAKLHFGSVTPFNPNGAFDWHYSLPAPDGAGRVTNGDYGVYRCLVDFMGHRDLGGKTLLYVVDGLWGSINWGHPATKWRMAPFNGDYPSSLFLSQDPVALDSVGYDFLYEEFGPDNPSEGAFDPRDDHGPFARYAGVDDYLHQAADPARRPAGFVYDPERDGTALGSLGVHEHWNNPIDKAYSRNLGSGQGIELLKVGR